MSNDKFIPISLPSRCLAYPIPVGTDIRIRPFKGREQELMAELNMPNLSKRLLTILENVFQGIDVRKLTVGDAEYAMIWEAINSYSNKRSINLICGQCEKSITVEIDLMLLEKIELSDEYKDVANRTLNLSSLGEIELRLLTLQDDINAFEFSQLSKDASSYLYSYASSIVNGKDVLANREMLEEADAKDLQKIVEWHQKYKHGVDLTSKYVCPLCKKEGFVHLPFRLATFFPFL
jgi:hypothetical protein